MAKSIYLDYAAATPLDQEVLAAMKPYLTENFYNPSATYLAARDVRLKLEKARAGVAGVLGCRPAEIVFTAGTTEANNLAIQGLMKQYPEGEIIISATEHESVLEPAKLFKRKVVPVDRQGIVNLNKLEKLISPKTVLISVGYVNNETGVIQPLKEITNLLRHIRNDRNKTGHKLPIYLHTDAAQSPCYLDLHVSRLGIDMMSLNGGKIYGPKQTGALYVKAVVKLQPLLVGGGQESGLRSGTENVANYIGLAAALKKAADMRNAELERVSELKKYFINSLEKINNATVNGSPKHSSPHIVNVTFPGVDNERLMMQLDEAGIQVAVGSACSASSREPSHVLKAMGLSDAQARSSLRLSFGRATKKTDINEALRLLNKFSK